METRATPKSHAPIFAWRKEVRTCLFADRFAIDANFRRQYSEKSRCICRILSSHFLNETSPDVVVAPVVGFDRAGYRLSYGGGFFDRRLASFPHRPFAIGVGYDAAAIRTIYPLPHDVPMEAIVTERNFQANERVQTRGLAIPA
jgi:5,10-methenyltetrahydrofolate synthetase